MVGLIINSYSGRKRMVYLCGCRGRHSENLWKGIQAYLLLVAMEKQQRRVCLRHFLRKQDLSLLILLAAEVCVHSVLQDIRERVYILLQKQMNMQTSQRMIKSQNFSIKNQK